MQANIEIEEVATPEAVIELLELIDSGIADFSGRTLLSSDEVVDFLLDIRLHVENKHDNDKLVESGCVQGKD